MIGMDRATGRPLDGMGHLRQSIGDILSTPLGTRVGRRDYGSLVPDMIDQAMNAAGRLRLLAATALAIARWEPRLRLTRVTIAQAEPIGAFAVAIEGDRLDVPAANSRVRLTLPLRDAAGIPAIA